MAFLTLRWNSSVTFCLWEAFLDSTPWSALYDSLTPHTQACTTPWPPTLKLLMGKRREIWSWPTFLWAETVRNQLTTLTNPLPLRLKNNFSLYCKPQLGLIISLCCKVITCSTAVYRFYAGLLHNKLVRECKHIRIWQWLGSERRLMEGGSSCSEDISGRFVRLWQRCVTF